MDLRKTVPAALGAALLAACSQGMAGSTPATQPSAAMIMTDAAPVTVGGQPMFAGKDIIDNAVKSADHTTLVAAVKAAGLVATLKGPGPFTVFAPTNEAFNALPPGTVPTLLKPENKGMLTKVLTYHVVSGRLDFAALQQAIMAGGGKAMLTTVAGVPLTVTMNGPHNIDLTDAKGDVAHISTYDVYQSNGVIQVIDTVLLPG
jgi:uncharacterized surface protein with fasciclin (FAS1) repeats